MLGNDAKRFANSPGKPYEGMSPYIFVSYCHSAWAKVYPTIGWLMSHGYRAWYDNIEGSSEWCATIQERIESCAVFVPFIDDAYCDSTMCRRELAVADSNHKDIVPIYLEKTKLGNGVAMRVVELQGILKYEIPNNELFYGRLGSFSVLKQTNSHANDSLHDTRLDAMSANRRLVDNGICICIKITPKYTSSIILYDRNPSKNCDTYYYVSDGVLDGLVERIRGLFSCILGIDEVTTSVNWKRRAGEYQCAKRDPGVAHLFSEGRIDFEVRVLQSIEKKHFNSFEFIISGSEMRLLLYKNGQYAFKGLSPSTPLSSFGIDRDRLLAVSNELIEFCNPGESVLFQNEIENVDSQINNSGCIYFVEKYMLESSIA